MHWNVYILIITLKVRHSENLYIHKNKTFPSSRLGKDGARRRGGWGERRRGGEDGEREGWEGDEDREGGEGKV